MSAGIITRVFKAAPRGLTPLAHAVLVRLAWFADEEANCYPAVATIAHDLVASSRGVRNAVTELRVAGLISVAAGSGLRGSNLVTLNMEAIVAAGQEMDLPLKRNSGAASKSKGGGTGVPESGTGVPLVLEEKRNRGAAGAEPGFREGGTGVPESGTGVHPIDNKQVTDIEIHPSTAGAVEDDRPAEQRQFSLTSKAHVTLQVQEQGNSRGTSTRSAHPLFGYVKDLVFRYYRNHNHISPEWDGFEGKALSGLLAANPDAPKEHWSACLMGRSDSDVNHAERPGKWLRYMSSYRNAVNTYNRPKESRNANTRVNQNLISLVEAIGITPGLADGRDDLLLPEHGQTIEGNAGSVARRLAEHERPLRS